MTETLASKRPVQTNGYHKASGLPNGLGVPLTNGTSKPNGTTPKTSHHAPSNVALVDTEIPSPEQTSSADARAGQKRKKSLD